MRRIKLWFFTMLILLLISFPAANADGNIKSVGHDPESPAAGLDVMVFMEVNSTSEIANVTLKYCIIDSSCYLTEMTLGANNTYYGYMIEDFEAGTPMGYNITIDYANGSKEYTPEGKEYHLFNITEGDEPECLTCPPERSLAIQILVVAIIFILAFLFIKAFRRKDKTGAMNKKLLAILVAVVIALSIASIYLFISGQEQGVIEKASEFALTDTDGNRLNLSDFEGKVVILDFMAVNCDGCLIVEETLKEIDSEYGDEVIIISIDIWTNTETNAQLKEHKEDEGTGWIYAMDSAGVKYDYNVLSIPKTMIIDRDGYVTFNNDGLISREELSKEINSALSGEAEALSISPMWIGALAFIAGVASFFSPCSFPLLPGYVGYYLGIEKSRQDLSSNTIRRALPGGIASALGILFIYFLVGMILFLLGSSANLDIALLAPIIGIVLIVLGALMLTNIQYYAIINPIRNFFTKLKIRKKQKQDQTKSSEGMGKKSLGGLFVFGIGYGAAAAGCTLPIFGAIVLGALFQGDFFGGIMLLFLYGFGAALFMIITTILVATSEDTIINKLKVSTDKIKKISGVLMIVGGVGVIIFYLIATGG